MSSFFEPASGEAYDARAIAVGCIESGSGAVLLDEGAAPDGFFDLSTGVAGELLHQLGKYDRRLAVVVPDPRVHSQAFRDFAREANRGGSYRFFPTRKAAVAWLEPA